MRSEMTDPELSDVTNDRVKHYFRWAEENNIGWMKPDLLGYSLHLQSKMNPADAKAHLSAIRSRYKKLLAEEKPLGFEVNKQDWERAKNHIRRQIEKTKGVITYNREINTEFLDPQEIKEILKSVELTSFAGVRDIAVIMLLLTTGIKESEIIKLTPSCIQETDPIVINVPETTGGASRVLVDYEEMFVEGCILKNAIGILLKNSTSEESPLITGYFRAGMRSRGKKISQHGIFNICERYNTTGLKLRKTFARRMYLRGVDLEVIKETMGHGTTRSTIEYIGLPEIREDVSTIDVGRIQSRLEQILVNPDVLYGQESEIGSKYNVMGIDAEDIDMGLLESLQRADGLFSGVVIHDEEVKEKLEILGLIETNTRGASYGTPKLDEFMIQLNDITYRS